MSTKTFICDGCGCEFRDTSSNPQKSFEDRVIAPNSFQIKSEAGPTSICILG
jgi:hypothetical protein